MLLNFCFPAKKEIIGLRRRHLIRKNEATRTRLKASKYVLCIFKYKIDTYTSWIHGRIQYIQTWPLGKNCTMCSIFSQIFYKFRFSGTYIPI